MKLERELAGQQCSSVSQTVRTSQLRNRLPTPSDALVLSPFAPTIFSRRSSGLRRAESLGVLMQHRSPADLAIDSLDPRSRDCLATTRYPRAALHLIADDESPISTPASLR